MYTLATGTIFTFSRAEETVEVVVARGTCARYLGMEEGYPVLRVGSTGSDVSDLQARLFELGYYTGTIDGKYASGTQEAVTESQSRNGLTADGIAGRQTQDLLYSASAQPKVISTSGGTGGYVLLKQGSSGLEVRKL